MSGLTAAAGLALLSWLWLATMRSSFWRCDQKIPDDLPDRHDWPEVVAIIPARDEEATIGRAVASLFDQDYPGRLSVVVVDDESRDGTVRQARSGGASVAVVQGAPLPAGWVGKVWAQAQGLSFVDRDLPDARWVLLTDADIEHAPGSVRSLVAFGEDLDLDLVSLMVKLRCADAWERLLIPAFVFFFQKLFPFPRVANPRDRTAAAAGGCMLVRRTTLTALGGMSVIRDQLIDDCALAEKIKARGRIWLGHATRTRSLREYPRLTDVWMMVARTAYTQLRYSPVLLAGTVLGMLILYASPPLAVGLGLVYGQSLAMLLGAIAWLTMVLIAMPTARLYGQPPWWGAVLPIAGLLYTAMTLDSARRHYLGSGGGWKGRHYDRPGGVRP